MIRDVLAHARVYRFFSLLMGAKRARRLHIARYIRPRGGDRLLDIGCGPADILDALPAVEYFGFDLSPAYIASAQKRFGARGRFQVAAVNLELIRNYADFDLVLATGVVHHLTDDEALDLFRVAKAALKPGGRLVTLDPCWMNGQSRIARFLLKRDRGEHIRDQEHYVALARQVFADVNATITTELLRIPYTHLVMECRAPTS